MTLSKSAAETASRDWFVVQIGAREHYAVARTLHQHGLLRVLFTDAWTTPWSLAKLVLGKRGDRLRGRYHAALADGQVVHFTAGLVKLELLSRCKRLRSGWDLIIERNHWFQGRCVQYFKRKGVFASSGTSLPAIFAYSYAARGVFELAREVGAKTVLCQIDGGEADARLMSTVLSRHAGNLPLPPSPPAQYWESWREECRLADRIIVNSAWSRDLLISAGIDQSKLVIVPLLATGGDGPACTVARTYPSTFTHARPLRVLLLGALSIRKGVMEALEAAKQMSQQPVHFVFVGADSDNLNGMLRCISNVTWHGAVPRSQTARHYANADIFLFPTHSDGFGLTQIEAQEYGLPIIASKNCGDVVDSGKTGLILNEVSGAAIEKALTYCLTHPDELSAMSTNCLAASRLHTTASKARLLEVIRSI